MMNRGTLLDGVALRNEDVLVRLITFFDSKHGKPAKTNPETLKLI
jgi:hypothetical protein